MVIIIDAPISKQSLRKLQALSSKVRVLRHASPESPIPKALLRDAEIIYTEAANFDPLDAPNLKWVQTNTVATNPQRGTPIFCSKIPVSNVRGAYSPAVAECAIALLLAVARQIPLSCRYQSARQWPENYAPFAGTELCGSTVGIVGYGSIGRQIGRIASGLGMTILACKRNPSLRHDDSYLIPGTGDPKGKLPREWFGPNQLRAMLSQSDSVIITLPQVSETQHLIGARELAALPAHAYLVNVGRGAVIDEAALIKALKSGRIAAAGLDVFENEPVPKSNPLWRLPNVVMMPHVASWTTNQADRAADVFIENVSRHLKRKPLLNLVDKKLMY